MPNIDQDLQKIMNARYGKDVRQSIHDAIKDINTVADNAESKAITAQDSAQNSATAAANSANTAIQKASEISTAATIAANNANTATQKANEASTAATNAANSATTASNKASEAGTSATSAANSANTATQKANEASTAATTATTKANEASNSASTAAQKATIAINSANEASACVEETTELKDNTEEYYNKVKTIADTLETGINPKGTIEFADLPSVAVASVGDTYHIVDDFVSTSDFMDGGGVRHTANSDVYKTSLGKWDVKENAISGIYVERDILHLPGSVINE